MILPDFRDVDYQAERGTEDTIFKDGFFISTEFLEDSIKELDGAEFKLLMALSLLSMKEYGDNGGNIVYLSKPEKEKLAAMTGNTIHTTAKTASNLAKKGFLVRLGSEREALYAINPLFIRRSADRDLSIRRIKNQIDIK